MAFSLLYSFVPVLAFAKVITPRVGQNIVPPAASSTLASGDFDAINVVDSDNDTAWSSDVCPTPSCYEWLAFWFDGNHYADYVRLVPRLLEGKPQAVPSAVSIYYAGPATNNQWAFLMTSSLENDVRSGNVIYLPARIEANGFLITTSQLGTDDFGAYYFQVAEVYAGDSEAWSKQIPFGDFVCDVYADSPKRILTNDDENFAYDFNVTKLSENSYVAVFHSEGFDEGFGAIGDSVGVRYGSTPDSLLNGIRTGVDAGDHIVTRTETPSKYMYHKGGSPEPDSQGANPILIKRESAQPPWTLFYLAVSDQGEPIGGAPAGWRHYLMVGHPWDVTSMANTNWASLANTENTNPPYLGDYWHWFFGGSIGKDLQGNRRSYKPSPARDLVSYAPVTSNYAGFDTPAGTDTQGLIGNISFGDPNDQDPSCVGQPELCKMYYFYFDYRQEYGGTQVMVQRESIDANQVMFWSGKTEIMTGWAQKIAYHPSRQRWAVLSICFSGGRADVCLQFSDGSQLSTLPTTAVPADIETFRLGLKEWFRDSVTGGVMQQFGILKNEKGQIAGDDFRLYVTERGPLGLFGLWGMDMSSTRVNCHP